LKEAAPVISEIIVYRPRKQLELSTFHQADQSRELGYGLSGGAHEIWKQWTHGVGATLRRCASNFANRKHANFL